MTFGLEMSHSRSLRLEPMECSALRHVAHELCRLDSQAKNPLRGGLRFRIVTEQDTIRQHIKIFINDQQAGGLSAPLRAGDHIQIICALSGG